MARLAKTTLTAALVKSAKPNGKTMKGGKLQLRRIADAGQRGLYLAVRSETAKFWVCRWTIGRKMREVGLGAAIGSDAVSLAEAREAAAEIRRQVRAGRDPVAERKAARAARKAADKPAEKAKAFKEAAEEYIKAHGKGWRNIKHGQQWRATLDTYCGGDFGRKPVAEIETADVLKVLTPIWTEKAETASRVRGRIESILDYSRVQGWRPDVPNPARWKGHLDHTLPRRSKVARVVHHSAIPWQAMPAFMAELRQQQSVSAAALDFCILTAARTGEVIGATWPEIDLSERIWTVPGERMKSGRPHRVPLSDDAVAILQRMERLKQSDDGFVFPGMKEGRGLSNMSLAAVMERMKRKETVHGTARSSFRDWAGEATSHPREVAEAALAHVLSDKTEAAYARGDLMERRRVLMADWCAYLKSKPATVVQLHPRAEVAS